MLTPQEVSERAFQKASFGGYNMGQVDEFLDILTADYTGLYNENAVLKSKMKVLVDKVEEYRATEDAMRKALMTAQRMADDLVHEAEEKKASIIKEAEGKVQEYLDDVKRQVEAEEFRLEKAKENTAIFAEKVRTLYAEQVEFLAKLQELAPELPKQEPDPVDETVAEIDDNVQKLLAKAMADATAENVKAKVEQEVEQTEEDLADTAEFAPVTQEDIQKAQTKPETDDEEPQPRPQNSRINFDDLEFGKNYEIF